MKLMIPVALLVCLIVLAGCGNSGNVARPSGTGAGTILTFTNISSITSQNSKTAEQLNSVTFANNQFVAVGEAGTIVTSADGVNWTIQNSPTPLSLYGICYGPGPSGTNQFIAVGGNDVAGFGVILTGTPDGKTWTVEQASDSLGGPLTAVSYANDGHYVAVGNNQVVSSLDGVNWNPLATRPNGITAPTVDLFSTAYGNNLYLAAGTYNTSTASQQIAYDGLIATSADAVNWTILPLVPNYLSGITYGGGQFVAVGREGSILTSTDGTTWATQSAPQLDVSLTPYLISVMYAGGQYVVTGNYVGTSPSTGFLLTSPDGVTWTMQPTGANVYGISYGMVNGVGRYVAVGGG